MVGGLYSLIIPGIMGLFKDKDKTGNIILLVVGILLLLGSQDIINFETIMKLVFPAILVIIGLSCLIKGLAGSDFQEKVKEIKSSDKDTFKMRCGFYGTKSCSRKSNFREPMLMLFLGA